MTRPDEKESLKIGEQYISCMVGWFLLEMLIRVTAGRFGDAEEEAAAKLVAWLGMPSGFAEIVAIFVIGTLLFPFLLLFQHLFRGTTPRYDVSPDGLKRTTNSAAYSVGRFIAWVFSKINRS